MRILSCLQNPIFRISKSMCEKHASGKNVEGIKHSRRDENPNPIVVYSHLSGGCCFPNMDGNITSAGMIDGVVKHFRKTIKPYVCYVLRHFPDRWGYIIRPNNVLSQFFCQWKRLFPLDQHC